MTAVRESFERSQNGTIFQERPLVTQKIAGNFAGNFGQKPAAAEGNGRSGSRNPSGWTRFDRQFRFPAGSGQIDPSRTRSSHFWPFPVSTLEAFGLQIRGPDHWATAARSRRFPGDLWGTLGWTLGWLAALAGWLGRPCLEEAPRKKGRFFPEKPPWKKVGFFPEKPPLVCVCDDRGGILPPWCVFATTSVVFRIFGPKMVFFTSKSWPQGTLSLAHFPDFCSQNGIFYRQVVASGNSSRSLWEFVR